ncbi:hypothetical protein [Empedobacter tilapiae]|uniref:hypothetical protein n=1 Tax=Empedobacter tilapiae TaxID=2491114 RepID=UPI0028CFE2F8|nr:hypothetical protein [Empedobacter tilapiae]
MKKIIVSGLILMNVNSVFGQVGIGISNEDLSTEELQVNGNMIVTNKIGQANKLAEVTEQKTVNGIVVNTDYRVIAQDPNLASNGNVKGQIKEMFGQQNVLPIIIQPYQISNVKGDDLDDVNLNIPSSDYFIAITNFEAIDNRTQGFPAASNKGRFEYNVFIGTDKMWHVKLRNPSINPSVLTNAFNYNFDILIYPKRFFKDLGVKTYNLGGNNKSEATTPIID